MRTRDGNGWTYDDEPTTPEEPGIEIEPDLNRRLREYRAMIALDQHGKKVHPVTGGYALTARELLDLLNAEDEEEATIKWNLAAE